VFGAIAGGYLMEHGNFRVLLQPAELVVIGGAAIGTILIGNPLSTIIRLFRQSLNIFTGSKFTKSFYLENLKMLTELFGHARKVGAAKLEADVDAPEQSPVFSKYPAFLANHHALHFVCDTLRMHIGGTVEPFDLDQMMELDMEVHHRGMQEPAAALSTLADGLPGLGIVAAVLGVVITMGAIGGPPEQIGQKVAAALVGTFLGILLCYGLVGPLAGNMAKLAEDEHAFYHVLRVLMASFMKGAPPIMAVEMARRAIPGHVRPSFKEVEKNCRTGDAAPAAAAAKAGA